MRLHDRVIALANFIYSEDGNNLLTAYRRAASIVGIEERRDGRSYDGEPDFSRFAAPEEKNSAKALTEVGAMIQQWLREENFETAMSFLARLRGPIDDFFDRVTVNTKQSELRENRLRLLSRIRDTMNRVPTSRRSKGERRMTKWVYGFGSGRAEGRALMRNLLGGKGAGLAEMSNLGLPVPPGFTITTEVCTWFYGNGKSYPPDLKEQVAAGLEEIKGALDARFGDADNPLLVSVRSGPASRCPG